jgi:hypothetical protein
MVDTGLTGSMGVSSFHCGGSKGAGAVTECSWACGSRPGRSGVSSLSAGIAGSGVSPGTGELGEGGGGPEDDVVVSVGTAYPGEGTAGGDEGDRDSGIVVKV